jgi:hypothetical protein
MKTKGKVPGRMGIRDANQADTPHNSKQIVPALTLSADTIAGVRHPLKSTPSALEAIPRLTYERTMKPESSKNVERLRPDDTVVNPLYPLKLEIFVQPIIEQLKNAYRPPACTDLLLIKDAALDSEPSLVFGLRGNAELPEMTNALTCLITLAGPENKGPIVYEAQKVKPIRSAVAAAEVVFWHVLTARLKRRRGQSSASLREQAFHQTTRLQDHLADFIFAEVPAH